MTKKTKKKNFNKSLPSHINPSIHGYTNKPTMIQYLVGRHYLTSQIKQCNNVVEGTVIISPSKGKGLVVELLLRTTWTYGSHPDKSQRKSKPISSPEKGRNNVSVLVTQ